MGHTRLGKIPKSRKWQVIIATVAGGQAPPSSSTSSADSDVAAIAAQTLEAAQVGLTHAINDSGLRYTFYLLTQLVLAARESNWDRLGRVGLQLESDHTLFDLTSQIQDSVDDYLATNAIATDISEMAQQAAGETLASFVLNQTGSLYDHDGDNLQETLKALSTKSGFSELGRRFFGSFMSRFMNFYLSRITAAEVGGTGLHQIGDVCKFNEALQLHCYQSARIVQDFCGEWYSKTEWQRGIDLETTSRFLAVAMKKLQAELQQQKVPDD